MKTILITGVSRGLGRALAEEFILLGHTVIGCGRSEKEIAQLQKQFPAPNDFAVVDVSSDEQVSAWAKRVLQAELSCVGICGEHIPTLVAKFDHAVVGVHHLNGVGKDHPWDKVICLKFYPYV